MIRTKDEDDGSKPLPSPSSEANFGTVLVPDVRFADTLGMGTHCRTLIVDDEEDMRFLAATAIRLANDGLTVAGMASSGEEALRALTECDPDVVVLDFRMPGRNGLEVAADLLAIRPELKIVLFSAYIDRETTAEAHRVGVQECVHKNDLRKLANVVRKYCPAA